MSRTALCEHTGLAAVGSPPETVTWKMLILHAWHWTWRNCRKMCFPFLAQLPAQTQPQQSSLMTQCGWLYQPALTLRCHLMILKCHILKGLSCELGDITEHLCDQKQVRAHVLKVSTDRQQIGTCFIKKPQKRM